MSEHEREDAWLTYRTSDVQPSEHGAFDAGWEARGSLPVDNDLVSRAKAYLESHAEWPTQEYELIAALVATAEVAAQTRRDTLEEAATEIERIADDPDRRRPMRGDAEFPTDLANDFQWAILAIRALNTTPEGNPT